MHLKQLISEEINIIETENASKIRLKEMSLNRIMTHVNKDKFDSWGIITGFRGTRSKKENVKVNKQLASDLRSNEYGFFKLVGHWEECEDENIPYEECPNKVDVKEMSFFVPGIDAKTSLKLMKKYKQDAIVYSGPETKDNIVLVFQDGSKEKIGTKLAPGKISRAFSDYKGKPFMFEIFF